jgi:PKD repeat protein
MWNNNTTNQTLTTSSPGSYSVAVTSANGCTSTDEIDISLKPLPDPLFASVEDWGGKVNFTAAETNASAYFWDFGDGNSDTGRAVEHIYSTNFTYEVILTVTGTNGCIDSLQQQVLVRRVGTGRSSESAVNSLTAFPNPYNNFTNIHYSVENSGDVLIEVFDMLGKKLAVLANEFTLAGEHNITFNARDYGYASGQFLVRMVQNDEVIVRQIVQVR